MNAILIMIIILFFVAWGMYLNRDQASRYCRECGKLFCNCPDPDNCEQDFCNICERSKCKCGWPVRKMK